MPANSSQRRSVFPGPDLMFSRLAPVTKAIHSHLQGALVLCGRSAKSRAHLVGRVWLAGHTWDAMSRGGWHRARGADRMPIRVLLADNHALVRQGLKALLEREGFEVVGEASDGQEVVRLVPQVRPEVAILDISMPLLNGLDATRELRRSAAKTKVVLLTRHEEDQYVTEALRAGGSGYVLKTQVATDLVRAIRQVCAGDIYLSPGISRAVVEAYLSKTDLPSDPLTAREREVLQLVGEGKSTKEVAVVLGISTKTAESHRTRLMQKLDIHETASLVRYAIRRGLVEP